MEVCRTPDERFEDLAGWPYGPHYVEQDGLRMHYVDEGEGDAVLLLHGEPTWGYLHRKVIPALVGVARVVAPDSFGLGRSDKPVQRAGTRTTGTTSGSRTTSICGASPSSRERIAAWISR